MLGCESGELSGEEAMERFIVGAAERNKYMYSVLGFGSGRGILIGDFSRFWNF